LGGNQEYFVEMTEESINKKNLLLIIPTLGTGGAQRALTKLSIELSKHYNIYICRFNTQAEIVYPYSGRLLSLDDYEGRNIFTKITGFFYRVRKLSQLKKQYAINISVSFLEGANYINVLSRTDDKIIISLRGSILSDIEIRGVLGWIRKKVLIRFIYPHADKIVSLSQGLQDEFLVRFGAPKHKMVTIYNHYDVGQLMEVVARPVPEKFIQLTGTPTLVMSSRLHPQKGHKSFLAVFAQLKQVVKVKLVIFGDGIIREELIAYSRRLELSTYSCWEETQLSKEFDVYFMGFVRDPFNYISKCSVFIFPSFYEGLGNALVESLACGIPVMASDCHSGPREVLAPGTQSNYRIQKPEFAKYGVLMPLLGSVHAEMEWKDVIKLLLSDKTKYSYYAEHGSQRLKDFSVELIIRQWIEVFEQ
jgi:glycosyltransferase involved in cell wall biosynthesis